MIYKPSNFQWASVLHKAFSTGTYQNIEKFIDEELKAGKEIYPSVYEVFDCFNYKSPEDIRVVIVGKEPYSTPGHSHGHAFSSKVADERRWPATLKNVFKAIKTDLKIQPKSAYLGSWIFQGVLLLNTCLTAEKGKYGEHKNLGWDIVVDTALSYLSSSTRPVAYLLWGDEAKAKRHILKDNPHQIILETSSPSPHDAHNGFMFCKHFSTVNKFLESQGLRPINWST